MYCAKCGRLLLKTTDWAGNILDMSCKIHKHDFRDMERKQKIGRYSGKSKSQNAFNDYQ